MGGYAKKALAALLLTGMLSAPSYSKDPYARSMDSSLEANMEAYVKDLRKRGFLSKTDETSFVVYDIDHDRKVASINEDEKMMSASTIKVFVMLAYFDRLGDGMIRHTAENRRLLRAMIQYSSNAATNRLMGKLGGPKAVEKLLARKYPFFDETDVKEYIPGGGRTYRNTTSAHDLNIFYNQLWRNRLPHADKMKYYLGLPGNDRIFDGTCIPKGTDVFNKTGTVYGVVADSGILVMKGRNGRVHPYAVTGMIEDRTKTKPGNRKEPYWSWAKKRANVVRRMSEGAYDYLYKLHNSKEFVCRQHGGRHLGGRQ